MWLEREAIGFLLVWLKWDKVGWCIVIERVVESFVSVTGGVVEAQRVSWEVSTYRYQNRKGWTITLIDFERGPRSCLGKYGAYIDIWDSLVDLADSGRQVLVESSLTCFDHCFPVGLSVTWCQDVALVRWTVPFPSGCRNRWPTSSSSCVQLCLAGTVDCVLKERWPNLWLERIVVR
jgi:hypothetical protein